LRFDFYGAADFLKAYPSADAEKLLLEMLPDAVLFMPAAAALGESGSAAVLQPMKNRLALAEAASLKAGYPLDHRMYSVLIEGIRRLENRIASGAAPESYPASSLKASQVSRISLGSRSSNDETSTFRREPFVWVSTALLLGAAGVLVWRWGLGKRKARGLHR